MLKVPMSSPDISDAEVDAVVRVLRTPFLSIGPKIVEFENLFAQHVGARYAVGVVNGTAGLHLAVIAAGVIGEGVSPPLTSSTARKRNGLRRHEGSRTDRRK